MRLALLIAAAWLQACSPAPAEKQSPPPAPAAAPAAPAAAPANLATPEIQAIIAGLPAPYNEGDYVNGRRNYRACASCHVIDPDAPSTVGPNLHQVFGRRAGTYPGYPYSKALQSADFVWDGPKLEEWLANPRTFLPGNKMAFVGVKDPAARRDIVTYLKVESELRAQ